MIDIDIDSMIAKLKAKGFAAEKHPRPDREILIKTERGEVEITRFKKRKAFHVVIDVDGSGAVKNCKTEDEVYSFLESEFIKKGGGKAVSFGEVFPF